MFNEDSYREQLRQGFIGRMQYRINDDSESGYIAPNQRSREQMPSLAPQAPYSHKVQTCGLANCDSPMSLGGEADRTWLYSPLKCSVLEPGKPHAANVMHAAPKMSDRIQEQIYEMELRKKDEDQSPGRYMQDDLRQRHLHQTKEQIASCRIHNEQQHEQVVEHLPHETKPEYFSQQQFTETLSQQPKQNRVGHEDKSMLDGSYSTLEEIQYYFPPDQIRKRSAEKVNQAYSGQRKLNEMIAEQRQQQNLPYEELQCGLACEENMQVSEERAENIHDGLAHKKMQHGLYHEEIQDRPTRAQMQGNLTCQKNQDRLDRKEIPGRLSGQQMQCLAREDIQDRLALEQMQDRLLREQMQDRIKRDRLELEILQDRLKNLVLQTSLSQEKERHRHTKDTKQNYQEPNKQESVQREEMQDRFVQRNMMERNPKHITQHETQTGKEMGHGFSANLNQQHTQVSQRRMQDLKELQDRYVQQQIKEHFLPISPQEHHEQKPMREISTQQRRECNEVQDRFAPEHLLQVYSYNQLDEPSVQENMCNRSQYISNGCMPKDMTKNRNLKISQYQMTGRTAQDQIKQKNIKQTSAGMNVTVEHSGQCIKEENELATHLFPLEVKIEYSRTQSPYSEIFEDISMASSHCSLMESHEKLSIRTKVSKGTAHNLRKIVRSQCKLHEVIDNALRALDAKDKEDKDERNSQKYGSEKSLTTQCSDFTEFDDVSLPSCGISQQRANVTPKPQISRPASNQLTTLQPDVASGEILCRCTSEQPNTEQKNSKLFNELRAHLEPPPDAHELQLCEVMQKMSKCESMGYYTGAPIELSFEDVLQSKVVTPMVTKLQQMYLHSLQDKVTVMQELQTLPQRLQEVYKASKELRSSHFCKDKQQAPQPN